MHLFKRPTKSQGNIQQTHVKQLQADRIKPILIWLNK